MTTQTPEFYNCKYFYVVTLKYPKGYFLNKDMDRVQNVGYASNMAKTQKEIERHYPNCEVIEVHKID